MGISRKQTERKQTKCIEIPFYSGKLSDFKNTCFDYHKTDTCFVVGLGKSIDDFIDFQKHNEYKSKIPIISVNYSSLFIEPTYNLILDRIDPNNENPDYRQRIDSMTIKSSAKYSFSKWAYSECETKWIQINTYNLEIISPKQIIKKGWLFSYNTATIAAISLACFMGFKKIGVIGFDIKGHPDLEPRVNDINNACLKVLDYCRETQIEILNLSTKSLITAFPFCSLDDFKNWYFNLNYIDFVL